MPDNTWKLVCESPSGWYEYYPTLNIVAHCVLMQGAEIITDPDRREAVLARLVAYGYWM